jgi:hypothetical protein
MHIKYINLIPIIVLCHILYLLVVVCNANHPWDKEYMRKSFYSISALGLNWSTWGINPHDAILAQTSSWLLISATRLTRNVCCLITAAADEFSWRKGSFTQPGSAANGGLPSDRTVSAESLPSPNHRKLSVYFKPETGAGDGHSLERKLYYNADVERPSFEHRKEVNRECVLVAT